MPTTSLPSTARPAAWDVTAALYERDEARDIERLRAGWTSMPAEEPLLRAYLPCGRACTCSAPAAPTRSPSGNWAHASWSESISPSA